MTSIRIVPDTTALARMAAETITDLAHEAIKDYGRFTLALSGGSTPKALFKLLAAEYLDKIDWKHTFIFWGDERCVPPNDADSNFRMARETLLEHVPIPDTHVFRFKSELPPPEAAQEYEDDLRTFFNNELPRIDLILLGMGDDGHTASLFPHTEALHETKRWVIENYVVTKQTWRLTLTAPVINNAANVLFLVAGTDKAVRLKQVLQGDYTPDDLPSQLIKPTNGNLIWGLDQAAAALL